jgi:hypothetical protein
MLKPVRVIGRVDLAEQISEVVRRAGFDPELVTAGPRSVYGGTPPAEGVDVVVATSIFDPPLWVIAKGMHPLRPMVAVAELRREPALRGALARRYGPDAYVTWPATPEDLGAAIRRAESTASRQRSWTAADVRAALAFAGLFMFNTGGGTGALLLGVTLLLGLRSAWNARWQAVGGVLLTALGGMSLAVNLGHWPR